MTKKVSLSDVIRVVSNDQLEAVRGGFGGYGCSHITGGETVCNTAQDKSLCGGNSGGNPCHWVDGAGNGCTCYNGQP
jgi:hypothetical protein